MDEAYGAIVAYFEDFNEAFASFCGSRVASKFSLPFLARSGEGVSRVMHNEGEVARYFQDYLDEYRAKGCVHSQFSELAVTRLGVEVAVATVRWSLLDSAESTVVSWRESYLLGIGPDMPTAFATIDHAS